MKKIIIALIIIFIFLQFFPIVREIPAATPQVDFLSIKQTPAPIAEKIRSSCYDCHSNETKYPAYARIQPLGWFVQNHIQEGRKELNFSTFASYDYKRQLKKLEEAAEMVEQGDMPLDSYLLAHGEANLSAQDRQQLSAYFRKVARDLKIVGEPPFTAEPSDFKIGQP